MKMIIEGITLAGLLFIIFWVSLVLEALIFLN